MKMLKIFFFLLTYIRFKQRKWNEIKTYCRNRSKIQHPPKQTRRKLQNRYPQHTYIYPFTFPTWYRHLTNWRRENIAIRTNGQTEKVHAPILWYERHKNNRGIKCLRIYLVCESPEWGSLYGIVYFMAMFSLRQFFRCLYQVGKVNGYMCVVDIDFATFYGFVLGGVGSWNCSDSMFLFHFIFFA
jgi:hypothetical protein